LPAGKANLIKPVTFFAIAIYKFFKFHYFLN